jgi:hypothetical protein
MHTRDDHIHPLVTALLVVSAVLLSLVFSGDNSRSLELKITQIETFLQGSTVCDISLDARGTAWVAVRGKGIYRFVKGDTDSTAVLFNGEGDGLPGIAIQCLWDLEADRDSTLWIAIWSKGLCALNDGGTAAKEDDLWRNLAGNDCILHPYLPAIDIDSAGDKWLGYSLSGETGGITHLYTDESDTTCTHYRTGNSDLSWDEITAVESAGDTALWIGLFRRHGLDVFNHGGTPADSTDDRWHHVDESVGLAANDVNAIFIDSSGNCWVGTSGGISRFTGGLPSDPVNLTTSEGLTDPFVNDIVEDWEGNLWIGTNFGLNFLSREHPDEIDRFYGSAQGLAGDVMYSLAVDSGERCLYVGTENGLNRIRYEITGTPDNIVLYPNPFIPQNNGHGNVEFSNLPLPVEITVFTASGDRVLSFGAARESDAFWDGKNADGRMVAPGIYFLLLTFEDNRSVVKKLAVIR